MNRDTVQTSDQDIWEQMIAAESMVEDFFRQRETPLERQGTLPSVAARLDQYFIPPLPWRLFCVLVALPGKAWVLYLVLWRLSRMYQTTSLTVTSTCLRGLGLSRYQKIRGLTSLEAAGLLTIERQTGKNPRVTLRPLHELFPRQEPAP